MPYNRSREKKARPTSRAFAFNREREVQTQPFSSEDFAQKSTPWGGPMQHTTEAPKQYQCRHIFTDGRRCASPCLRQQEFCYYHHTTRRPVANPTQRRTRRSTFNLPLPEDRSAIQASIGEVLQRIAANEIDPRRAGLLLYGLQIASLNLPKPPAHRKAKPEPIELVEDIPTAPELRIHHCYPFSTDGLSDQNHYRPLRCRSHHSPRPPHRPQLRQLHRPLHPPRRSGADQSRVPSLRRTHRHPHLLVHDRLHAHLAPHRLAGRPLLPQTNDRHCRALLERRKLLHRLGPLLRLAQSPPRCPGDRRSQLRHLRPRSPQ